MIVNISMNKKSNYKGELYTKRKDIISYFNKFHKNNFDLYGVGWNQRFSLLEYLKCKKSTFFTTYKGPVTSKLDVLEKYKYAICFENNNTENGWITEKIFDCFTSRCVPIYLGSPNIIDYIPLNCFIDMRNFNTYDDLYLFLNSITEENYNQYLINIDLFLNSNKYKQFLSNNFINTITNVLKLNS
jgi:hypothetical protein